MFARAGTSGRFTVFVITDAAGAVFENGSESNNAARARAQLDLMPIPYADLRRRRRHGARRRRRPASPLAVDVDGDATTASAAPTSIALVRHVTVARDADGTNVVVDRHFDHIGVLEAGGSYVRTAQRAAAERALGPGLRARPHRAARTSSSSTTPATPRHARTGAGEPVACAGSRRHRHRRAAGTANEGDTVDITWTVRNTAQRPPPARGRDTIFLRKPGLDPKDPATPKPIVLGTFTYTAGLGAGMQYTRTERFTLPARTEGAGRWASPPTRGNTVFEGEPGAREQHDARRRRARAVAESAPRPAGASRSRRPTTSPPARTRRRRLHRRQPRLGRDDDAALDRQRLPVARRQAERRRHPASARSTTVARSGRARATRRRRRARPSPSGSAGRATSSSSPTRRTPSTSTRTTRTTTPSRRCFVDPQPLADLVTSDVVVPSQAVYGAEITVTVHRDEQRLRRRPTAASGPTRSG